MNVVCYKRVCFEWSVMSGLLWTGLFWTDTICPNKAPQTYLGPSFYQSPHLRGAGAFFRIWSWCGIGSRRTIKRLLKTLRYFRVLLLPHRDPPERALWKWLSVHLFIKRIFSILKRFIDTLWNLWNLMKLQIRYISLTEIFACHNNCKYRHIETKATVENLGSWKGNRPTLIRNVVAA